jgi:hypothetical protein
VNVTDAVCTTVTESVESEAVYVEDPAVVDFTVKVTTPDASEEPEAAETVSVAARLDESVTALPGTGAPLTVRSVTVTVALAEPSATTVAGIVATVEVEALTAGVSPDDPEHAAKIESRAPHAIGPTYRFVMSLPFPRTGSVVRSVSMRRHR